MHLIGNRRQAASHGANCQRDRLRAVMRSIGRPVRGGGVIAVVLLATFGLAGVADAQIRGEVSYFPVARGAHPHDVAATPQAGGPVYYTEQASGKLGILDPVSGRAIDVALGERSAPHGVIVGPDRAAWVTDGGQNAIVRVDA